MVTIVVIMVLNISVSSAFSPASSVQEMAVGAFLPEVWLVADAHVGQQFGVHVLYGVLTEEEIICGKNSDHRDATFYTNKLLNVTTSKHWWF